MPERVVLAKRGTSSMVKARWTEACPDDLNDLDYAEELGATWEGDELVTYDLPGLVELLKYYTDDDYMSDND